MGNTRAEAFEIARKLAEERGGRPSQYMKEAWDTVNGNGGRRRPPSRASREESRIPPHMRARARRPQEEDDDDDGGENTSSRFKNRMSHVGDRAKRRAMENIKGKVRKTARDWNFMREPKDNPKETLDRISGGIFTKKTDPIPEIPKPLKDMLRIW